MASLDAEPAAMEPVQGTPAAKRRRLSGKTRSPLNSVEADVVEENILPVEPDFLEPVAAEVDEEDLPEDGMEADTDLSWQQCFHNSLRRWSIRVGMVPNDGKGRNPLRPLTLEQRADLVERWANEDELAEEGVKNAAVSYYCKHRLETAKTCNNKWVNSNGVLLTWNGSWGAFCFDDLGLTPPYPPVPEVCLRLQKHPDIVALRKSFEEQVLQWAMNVNFAICAYSFELCAQTYKAATMAATEDVVSADGGRLVLPVDGRPSEPVAQGGRPIRVHIHAFFRRDSGCIQLRSPRAMAFQLSLPVKSTVISAGRRATRACRTYQGIYYVQCPKVGMIFYGGTVRPFEDYLVNGEWALNLVQQGKMSIEDAHEQIVRSAKNLTRLLDNLNRLRRERETAAMLQTQAETEKLLALHKRPFRELPEVTEWLATFREVKPRYKFLVLEGPSMVGKTHYARSLSPNGVSAVFEADCAGKNHPDLRALNASVHDTIIFDEASVQCVLLQKKLFQSSSSMVTLGSSATNMHSFSLWCHRMRMIVTSNRWLMELRQLPSDDAEWLKANSVHVPVTGPLYA